MRGQNAGLVGPGLSQNAVHFGQTGAGLIGHALSRRADLTDYVARVGDGAAPGPHALTGADATFFGAPGVYDNSPSTAGGSSYSAGGTTNLTFRDGNWIKTEPSLGGTLVKAHGYEALALAAAGLNILGQHLKTDERTGYVITDVDRDYDPEALRTLKNKVQENPWKKHDNIPL